MNSGHTDLRIGVSGAKFDPKSNFEVHFAIGPPKPREKCKRPIFLTEKTTEQISGVENMKCWESSEARFGKV